MDGMTPGPHFITLCTEPYPSFSTTGRPVVAAPSHLYFLSAVYISEQNEFRRISSILNGYALLKFNAGCQERCRTRKQRCMA